MLFRALILAALVLTCALAGDLQISAGGSHTCVVLKSGALKCFGSNVFGQCGADSTTTAFGRNPGEMLTVSEAVLGQDVRQVSAGFDHTCVLLKDGTVKCFGKGINGRIGTDSTANVADGVGLSALEGPRVNVTTATSVQAGEQFSCALLEDKTVACWGSGNLGQMNRGDADNVADGITNSGAIASLNLTSTVKKLALGSHHACVIFENDDTVRCWGWGGLGQLGNAKNINIGLNPGDPSALVAVDLGAAALDVCAGDMHSCALMDDFTIKCWGNGLKGALGTDSAASVGYSVSKNTPTIVLGLGDRTIHNITCGGEFTCALVDDGAVVCWGDGALGALGNNLSEELVRCFFVYP